MLEYAAEVIPLYERWFGPYSDDEFEIAASFFGWNGNECSGLVLLDDRVHAAPLGRGRATSTTWSRTRPATSGGGTSSAPTATPRRSWTRAWSTAFTAIRLDAKYGRNAPLIVWPRGLGWLPTIGREDLRLAGYYGWRARGNTGPVDPGPRARWAT